MPAGDGMPPDPLGAEAAMVAAAADAMDSLDAMGLFALVAGYKQRMIDVGFSTEAAEAMAVEYHRIVMAAQ